MPDRNGEPIGDRANRITGLGAAPFDCLIKRVGKLVRAKCLEHN